MPSDEQIFVGVTAGGDFRVHSTSTSGQFDVSDATTGGSSVPPIRRTEPAATDNDGLAEWTTSDEALLYQGRWVLLDEDFTVIDSDSSPSELLARNADLAAPIVVFVQPRNRVLIV